MGLLDAPLRAAVKTVIDTLGTSCTVRIITAGDFDVESGKQQRGEADTALNGAVIAYDDSLIGDRIHVGDKRLMLPAIDLATAPLPDKHQAVVNGVLHRIVNVTPYQASDQIAAFELQIRTGT